MFKLFKISQITKECTLWNVSPSLLIIDIMLIQNPGLKNMKSRGPEWRKKSRVPKGLIPKSQARTPDPDVLKKVLPTLYVDSPKYKALL